MQAGQAFRMLERGTDGGDRDRRGVGAEDAVGGDDAFEVGVQLLLGFEALDDGFDDERAAGQIGEVFDRLQACTGGRRRRSGQLAFFGHFAELGADAGYGLGGGARPVVEQTHDMAGGGCHLGDAGAHCTGADDGNDALLG